MESAPIPDDDGERLAELAQLGIIDAPQDEQLDRINAAAAQYFGSSISLVTLVDRDRQIFKSKFGLDITQTSRDISFCSHAIVADGPFIVADARVDERFADNPLVTGQPEIGFYAGYPVKGPGGHRLGTFCIIDQQLRTLNDAELTMLQVFGEATQNRIAQMARTQWLGSPAQLLAAATNAAGIGLWEWDIASDVLRWDDKMYALYGIEAADFTGSYDLWAAGLHPDDRDEAGAVLERALTGDGEYDTQFRVVWPSGETHWIQSKATVIRDESGNPTSMLGLNWDITTPKAIEAELAAAAARDATAAFMGHVEAAISELPFVLYGVGLSEETRAGRWLLGDSERLVGVSKTDFDAGADILSNVFPDDRADSARRRADTDAESDGGEHAEVPGVTSFSEQIRVVGRDGSEKWIQHFAKFDYVARTETGALLDIDIEKRFALKQNESEKMEALGRLAGGIAQDFNNILGAIANFATLARDAAGGDAAIQADLGQIIAATERADTITRQLLTAYRPSVALHMTDLNQRVAALKKFLSTAVGAAVRLRVQRCDGQAMVLIDPAELDRVIINLALHARGAMPSGGDLDIIVSRVEGQPGDSNVVARLTVSDNGVGMSPDAVQRVFEPFRATGEFVPDGGLGLFTSFGIIKEAGGTILCDSVEGVGTTFTIDLPLLEVDAPATEDSDIAADVADRTRLPAPPGAESPEPSVSLRADAGSSILLVDDDPALRMSTIRVLEREGFVVTAVSTVKAAREALQAGDVDLLISDLRLPDGDGMDFAREVKHTHEGLPVLLWTGQPTIEAATRAVRQGVAGFLIKPVSARDLIRAANDAIGEARQLRLRNRLMASQMGSNEFLAELSEAEGALAGLAKVEEAFAAALSSLHVHFQPIVHADDSSVFGYEALLRCNGSLFASTPRFIAAAELLGRIGDVGFAVRGAVADVLTARPGQAPTIFVNLHPSEVRADVLGIAAEPLLPFATQIVLEITEGAALAPDLELKDNLARLRESGYRIAIDDLGEGYAGLSSLVRVNPDIVKIDMSLVSNIDRTPLKQDIVSAIIGMARPHRILVVGEGVETEAERATLRELGCDLLQGYLFAEPGPPFVESRTAFDD